MLTTYTQALYRARSTPLALVPSAGLLAPVSRLAWAFPHEFRGTITLDLPKLHERLGVFFSVLCAFEIAGCY